MAVNIVFRSVFSILWEASSSPDWHPFLSSNSRLAQRLRSELPPPALNEGASTPTISPLPPVTYYPLPAEGDYPLRAPLVGEWRVVAPAAAVQALAQPGGSIPWDTVCAGTASQSMSGFPRVGTTNRVYTGGVFQGDAVELFRQQRAGLCVLLLHHPSMVDPSGRALPSADLRVGVHPWLSPRGDVHGDPGILSPAWRNWAEAHGRPDLLVGKSHVPFTYRSRSSITVVRDAVLWEHGLTFARSASFGGGGCQ